MSPLYWGCVVLHVLWDVVRKSHLHNDPSLNSEVLGSNPRLHIYTNCSKIGPYHTSSL